MLANATSRADIQDTSATTLNFAASAALASRPIRLWALSGRQAALTALPTALTISGTAGTRYVYASLAAPSGEVYSTASGGILDKILSMVSWNRLNLVNAYRALHPGDGTLLDPGMASGVTLVETASATPPDTHHIPLGQFECAGGVITSVTSYEGQVSVTVSAFIHGQCRLSLSGGNLTLLPYNGTSLVIGGTARAVPGAGVTLAPAGLTPGTFYDLYASWSGAAIVLEASTTGHVTHTDGVEIKSGDSTRTYVGWAYIEAGPTWSTVVLVQSWFNNPYPGLLIREVGNPIKTIVSTVVETSLFTAVPKVRGGIVDVNRGLRITVGADYLNTSGSARSLTIRFKYGGTTFGTVATASTDNSANRQPLYYSEMLCGTGATNTQFGATGHQMSDPGTTNAMPASNTLNSGAFSGNTGAIDTTVDQPLDVTAQHDNAHASQDVRPKWILVELI